MSRGNSKIQNTLFISFLKIGKPVTFDELCRMLISWGDKDPNTVKFKPSKIRSLRRSLQGLRRDELLITLGSGGRADPFRYFIHPMNAIAMEPEKTEQIIGALEKAPGGLEALVRSMPRPRERGDELRTK
jgi:hypothetical protein